MTLCDRKINFITPEPYHVKLLVALAESRVTYPVTMACVCVLVCLWTLLEDSFKFCQ